MKNKNLIYFALLSSLICLPLKASLAEFYGTITESENEVFFQPEGRTKWYPVINKLGLKTGDKIKTGKNSSAILVFDDGSSLKIKQNSIIKVDELSLDFAKKIAKISCNAPKKGSFLANVKHALFKPKFEIKTPIAVAAVRGTDLVIETDEGSTEIMVFEGRVLVKDFIEDSALPDDGNELLLTFLHEVSLKRNRRVKVTKSGISKPRRIKKKTARMLKEELETLKKHAAKQQKETAVKSRDERQKERKKIRDKVLSKIK